MVCNKGVQTRRAQLSRCRAIAPNSGRCTCHVLEDRAEKMVPRVCCRGEGRYIAVGVIDSVGADFRSTRPSATRHRPHAARPAADRPQVTRRRNCRESVKHFQPLGVCQGPGHDKFKFISLLVHEYAQEEMRSQTEHIAELLNTRPRPEGADWQSYKEDKVIVGRHEQLLPMKCVCRRVERSRQRREVGRRGVRHDLGLRVKGVRFESSSGSANDDEVTVEHRECVGRYRPVVRQGVPYGGD